MIDYYQGIEIKTGHSIAYLQSLAARIRSTDSANHIYKILNDIDAELADRENLGNFDDLSRQLIQKLPEIKLYFINDDAKIISGFIILSYLRYYIQNFKILHLSLEFKF